MDYLSELNVHLFMPVLVIIILCGVAIGLGGVVQGCIFKIDRPRLIESFALGTLAISLLTFLWGTLGWMGSFDRLTLLLPLFAVAAIGWIGFRPAFKIAGKEIRNSILVLLIMVLLACVAALLFNLSLKPPTMCDECNLHLPAAMEILRTGKIEYRPHLNFNNFPQNVEMLFAWSMAYSVPATSHLVNFLAFLFLIAIFVRLARVALSAKIGWLAALIFSSLGGVKFNVVHANVDIWVLLYISVAVMCIVEGMKEKSNSKILLAGVMLGAAAGVKYTTLIAVITLVPAVLAIYFRQSLRDKYMYRVPVKIILLATGLAILAASPWYIRNVIWFGNPFFPFYSKYFYFLSGTYSNLAPDLIIDQKEMLASFSRDQYLKSGVFLEIFFKQFTLWAAVPCGIWFVRSNPFIKTAVVWTLLSWLFWQGPAGGLMYYRYYIYLYTVNILLLAHLVIYCYKQIPHGIARKISSWIIVSVLIAATGWMLNSVFSTMPPVTTEDKTDILRREHGCYDLVMAANSIIGEDGSAVGVCVEDGRFYAEFELIGGSDAGYAGNFEIASYCSSPEELSRCLTTKYRTKYFMVQKILTSAWEPTGLEPVMELIASPGFNNMFEEVVTTREGSLYRVRRIPAETGTLADQP